MAEGALERKLQDTIIIWQVIATTINNETFDAFLN